MCVQTLVSLVRAGDVTTLKELARQGYQDIFIEYQVSITLNSGGGGGQ